MANPVPTSTPVDNASYKDDDNDYDVDEDFIKYPFTRWNVRAGRFRPISSTILECLPAGIYEADTDSEGMFLSQVDFPADSLLSLPGMPIDFILSQIDKFWRREKAFEECGFLHKRGILLYGPAGCGKTSIIRLLCNQLIQQDGIVLYINNNISLNSSALHFIRSIEPTRKILTIIEDIEEYTESGNSSSRHILSLLDGEEQINHVVHIATTNKPEVLEDRIVKRPGRFDLVIGLNPPTAEARYAYLKSIVKNFMPEEKLQELVKRTSGLGLAHLRELIAATYCLELPLDETLERLQDNSKRSPKIKKNSDENGCGFTVNFFSKEIKKT